MGHALNGSIQDALVRHHRMARPAHEVDLRHRPREHRDAAPGRAASSSSLGTSREELGREAFLERAWSWRERYGATIVEQYKRLGASCDYADERFTLDAALRRRGAATCSSSSTSAATSTATTTWSTGTRAAGSAISDLEVEEREETDTLYSIAYPLADGSGELVVATVRPETMLADSAVAVNPADERYAQLVGARGRAAARRAAAAGDRRRLRQAGLRHAGR